MGQKLEKHVDRGQLGWDGKEWEEADIHLHVIRALKAKDFVSAANYTMFLWNREVDHEQDLN